MTLTTHGHHIMGTTDTDEDPRAPKARCGGVGICIPCNKESANSAKNQQKAAQEVARYESGIKQIIEDLNEARKRGNIRTYGQVQQMLYKLLYPEEV